jgi:hypothetical protein
MLISSIEEEFNTIFEEKLYDEAKTIGEVVKSLL